MGRVFEYPEAPVSLLLLRSMQERYGKSEASLINDLELIIPGRKKSMRRIMLMNILEGPVKRISGKKRSLNSDSPYMTY